MRVFLGKGEGLGSLGQHYLKGSDASPVPNVPSKRTNVVIRALRPGVMIKSTARQDNATLRRGPKNSSYQS